MFTLCLCIEVAIGQNGLIIFSKTILKVYIYKYTISEKGGTSRDAVSTEKQLICL